MNDDRKYFFRYVLIVGGIFIALPSAIALILNPPLLFPPDLIRGTKTELEFQQRVRELLPVPVDELSLRTFLEDRGFDVSAEHEVAEFHKPGFPCRRFWRVYWEADDETVTEIGAIIGSVCL